MRALLLLVALLLSLALRASAIAVVYAERSVPEGERRFAKALAGHVQRWYAEAGVETDLVADGALGKVRPRLAVLVDCYAPPADVVEAVRKRLAGGTRFVVCYSGSDALARLFGLRAGAYRRSSDGAWSKMSFAAQRPSGAPREILQTSSNLFTVTPLPSNGAKPMAWWLDRQGRRTEVAWWKAPNGSYWMTHVLSGDGDEEAKRRLLLAFAGECVPGVWRAATQHLYREASAPLEDGSLLARIRLLPKTSPRRQRLDGLYEGLLRQQAAVREALGKDAFAAYQAVCDLRDVTARVYGMTYWSRPNEIRGVWDHSGQGLFPGDWERTAALLAASGITDLYVNVAGAAFALYPSRVIPRRGTDDCLAQAIAACKKHGLRVHAWILAFSGERAAPGALAELRKKGWMLQDEKGNELNWLDPTHPAVRAYLLSAVKELSGYDLDGIHLDFIRYPGLAQSLGPRLRARFEADCGKAPGWPACVTDANGSRRAEFLRWRAERVADAVQSVRTWLRAHRPGMQLSAAVFGKYPACVDSVGQDWLSWLRTGLIDQALPMNYTESLDTLRDWLGTQTAEPRLAARIVSGVGVTAAESRLGPIETLQQIDAARKAKCVGFALFDLDETLRRSILPVLSEGISKP